MKNIIKSTVPGPRKAADRLNNLATMIVELTAAMRVECEAICKGF